MLPLVTHQVPRSRASAYYVASVPEFVSHDCAVVLGKLARAHSFTLDEQQRDAWDEEVRVLKDALNGVPGTLYLEFDVPRLGSRIDAVLVSGAAIFPIEFKCGEREYHLADYNQAWDYALDRVW